MARPKDQRNAHLPQGFRFKHGKYRYMVPEKFRDKWDGRVEFTLCQSLEDSIKLYEERATDGKPITEIHDFLSKYDIVDSALNLPSQTGVYFLIKGQEVVYVGQSTGILSRILSHSDKDFDKVAFIPVQEQLLLLVKTHYIKILRPKYNVEIFGTSKEEW